MAWHHLCSFAGMPSLDPEVHERAARELIRFGAAAAEASLLISTCGNASVRVDARHLLISATGSELPELTEGDLSLVDLASGEVVAGPKPSMELGLHRAVYRQRSLAGAVLHCQARAATLVACMKRPPENLDFILEVPAYVRRHATVPFAMPGSADLAASVERAFRDDPEVTLVQLRNHGQVVAGETWKKAIRRAVFFETACWIATRGVEVAPIGEPWATELRSLSRDV